MEQPGQGLRGILDFAVLPHGFTKPGWNVCKIQQILIPAKVSLQVPSPE